MPVKREYLARLGEPYKSWSEMRKAEGRRFMRGTAKEMRYVWPKRKAPGEGAIRIRITLTFLTCR